MRPPVKLFISYAKDNRQKWLLPMRQHLLGLQRIGMIEIWEDSRIDPGEGWDETIDTALGQADIVLLLVSSAFTASKYCHQETTRALKRREDGSAHVVWIYADHCDYGAMPFSGLEGMPKDKNGRLQPLVELKPKDLSKELAAASAKVRSLAAKIAEMRGEPTVAIGQAEHEGHAAGKGSAQVLVTRVSVEQDVPIDVLRPILADFGAIGNATNSATIEAQLRAKAVEYKELSARLGQLGNTDPRIGELRTGADSALAAGDFEAADEALAEAEMIEVRRAQELQREVDRLLNNAAATRAERAVAARLRLDYLAAAEHFGEAAGIVAPLGDSATWRYLLKEASNLEDHGRERGDNEALRLAIARYRTALDQTSRVLRSDDWATTQNNLGNALATLGARESGTVRLGEAVIAFQAALEERVRERVPLNWAATQNNLGNALKALGQRENGTARLEEAVMAYRAALEERARERVPLDWAATQNNLGNALRILGQREIGTVRLEEAVAAYRAALEERTRERVPLDWAATQNYFGNALRVLGQREKDITRLEEAVDAYRGALEERTRERVPLYWATTQNNLGNALKSLGELENGTVRLEEAVAAYRAALEERTRERVPLDWAMTQNNLGEALELLADRRTDPAMLAEAITSMSDAVEVFRDGGASYWLPPAEEGLARMRGKVAAMTGTASFRSIDNAAQ